MLFDGLRIGFALTGSYCTLSKILSPLEKIVENGAEVTPILSEAVARVDTRFGKAEDWKRKLEEITGKGCLTSIVEVEPIGPRKLLDILIVAPCTGNTLGKLAGGITDSAVTMAVKAHLRNQRPVVIALSTNDGLSASGQNIGKLLNTKNIFMVPFNQDDAPNKPTSLVAKMDMIVPTIEEALKGKQIQPVYL